MNDVPVIIVTGPSGSGKTTTCWEIREILRNKDIPHALVDLDNIRWCHVPGSRDRYNRMLVLKNLSALWRNFQEAGATHLVLSGVVENHAEVVELEGAVPGARVQVFRLHLDDNELERRIRQREQGLGLDRNLARARELSEIMDRNSVGSHVVNAGRELTEIADDIVSLSGWLR
ncbi:AAA family ATPase [Frankia sp. BMG5.23]|uniref:AAA family ATPase n=1 Tax=Frankia sp. BMG5.23 TaxID=683305 RepID=UPI000461DD0C|nr:AAA family ATPase [Frankia sp. BMG5.23]KDA44269.1 hypothetical protein BMG523Draft_00765 [Frankia sp. BMG5.23]